MIDDGYTRHAVLRDGDETIRLIYRPALKNECRRVMWHLWFLNRSGGSHAAEVLANEFMQRHVVASEWIGDLFGLKQSYPEMYRQMFLVIQGLIPDESGEVWETAQDEYETNLRTGIAMEFENPRLARRSCEDCKKHWYNEETGLPILRGHDQTPMPRVGPTMCETDVGCPRGTPEKPIALNRANRWAYRHFQECEAIGQFPDDPIVKRNAIIIRAAVKKAELKRKTRKR